MVVSNLAGSNKNICTVQVADSASVFQNGPNECFLTIVAARRIVLDLYQGTCVVGLLGCLVDLIRPITMLVKRHAKVLCCVSQEVFIYYC